MPSTIRIIGSLNADLVTVTPRFPAPGETLTASSFTTSPGGKGANQAVACGRLSRSKPSSSSSATDNGNNTITVQMLGAVGGLDTHYNTLLHPRLTQCGIDTTHIRTIDDAYTGVAVIIVDSSAGGENRILLSPGANFAGMRVDAVREVLRGLDKADVLVLQAEIPVETVVDVLKGVAAERQGDRCDNGTEVVFNPAPAPEEGSIPQEAWRGVDHLIMNETECDIMAPRELKGLEDVKERRRKVAEYYHGLGVRYVVVTLGAEGVWYSAADVGVDVQKNPETWLRHVSHVPAGKVDKVVDTTGAGDTFVGGYAVRIAQWRDERKASGRGLRALSLEDQKVRYQQEVDEAIRWAVRASTKCIQQQGAMDSIPWRNEI